jgi:DNA polymerase-3 subunit delta'
MQWNNIIGHDEIVAGLQLMLANGKIPHAFLFSGYEGIGKSTVARLMAAALLCTGAENKPCGVCRSCRMVACSAHPDLLMVEPLGNVIKIDQIRQIAREVALASYAGQHRVVVIENADSMTAQAANSLLKILEEPPERLIFILVSHAREKMLDTILSRCQLIQFAPLDHTVLAKALVERGYDANRADTAARLSGGRMGTALSLLEPDGFAVRDAARALVASLPDATLQWVWDTAVLWDKMERPQVLSLFKYISYLLRDMMVLVTAGERELLFNIDMAGSLQEQSRLWDEPRLACALADVDSAGRALSAHAGIRLTSEALLIRLRGYLGEE